VNCCGKYIHMVLSERINFSDIKVPCVLLVNDIEK
jgi:hypothetical protein